MKLTTYSGEVVDTWEMAFPALLGLFRWMSRAERSQDFNNKNGPNTLQQVARTIRARAYKEKHPLARSIIHMLNQADPPKCRCGKPGTRIAGASTFCSSCGPLPAVKQRLERMTRQRTVGLAERNENFERWNALKAKRENFRKNFNTRFGR